MRSFTFPGIVECSPAGSYGLFFPDLPGCVTSADSLDGLASNAREALQLHLEGMAQDGLTIPEPTPINRLPHDDEIEEVGILVVQATPSSAPTSIILSLPADLLTRVDAEARSRGATREQILTEGAEALLKAG
ncbi:MAG: type II toxin-antitoxin system HicB family antitoxin [Caulobacter sp.]|nr:type II toxin-antitoxin system HicB family antitoxin [Caulobacter sp.]